MTSETAAYLAGIIDGEGCIGLAKRKGIYVTPTLQVSNTDRELVEWLAELLDGAVYPVREPRPTRKPVFLFSIAGEKARSAIRAARPYLRVKARQADVILGLVSVYEMGTDSLGRPSRRLTEASLTRNREAIETIKALNKRGV